MKCKKCGTEIKEECTFCTNCGTNVNTNEIKADKVDNKNRNKYLKITLPLVVIIIIIFVFIGIILNSKNNEKLIEVDENNDIEKMYITQDSDISPTGKEFMGRFSNKLTELYESNAMENTKFVTYDTSIENMKKYNQENYINDNNNAEESLFYNSLNNHIIGIKMTIKGINELEKALNQNGTSLVDYGSDFIKKSLTISMDYANMEEKERNSKEEQDKFNKYQDFLVKVTEENSKTLTFDNYICSYNIYGLDFLFVYTKFNDDTNKGEFLVLAHDENTDPEETIKNWYNTVYTEDEISQTEENLLEEIYTKYPELENADIPICTDEKRNLLAIR